MPILQVLGKEHIYCGRNRAQRQTCPQRNSGNYDRVLFRSVRDGDGSGCATGSAVGRNPIEFGSLRLTDFKAPVVFKGDFTPHFSLKRMHKDLELAIENAYAQNVPMPGTVTVNEIYGLAKAQGKGELDYAAVITLFEEVGGVKVRTTGDARAESGPVRSIGPPTSLRPQHAEHKRRLSVGFIYSLSRVARMCGTYSRHNHAILQLRFLTGGTT
jgi:hypothetical protein